MRKLICLMVCLGILTLSGTAIAEDPPNHCSLIKSQIDKDRMIYYINPKHISHLISGYDEQFKAIGTSGRYMLFVSMTNANVILYGSYQSEQYRKNAINYIYRKIAICNE